MAKALLAVALAPVLLGAAPQIEPSFGARTFESLVKTAWPWGAGTVKIDGKAEAWPREGSALRVETERHATQDGFAESYRFRNISPQRISLGEIDINTPFNDDYRGLGKDGGAGSCHAHVWPGGNSAWVCAMRMNGKPPHLGLVVTEGAITGYELKERALDKGMSNTRGLICLSPPDVVLEPGAEYVLSWRVFEHQGKDDFFRKLLDFGGVKVTADRWVVTEENPASVTFEWKGGRETREIAYSHEGEIRVPFAYGDGKTTHAELLGIADPMEHVLRRARFIVAHQQYLKEGDAYDGAFVPYDSETGRQHRRWLDGGTQDWAPGAERFGIGISLAMLVERGYDEFREPLRRFARFAESLCHDGYVFADHMPDSRRRDFNTPWAARFFIEYGRLTGERRYFELAFRVMRDSYRRLGTLLLVEARERETIAALREAGLGSEADELQALFTAHKDAVLRSAGKLRTEEVCFAPEGAAAHVTQFLDNYELTGKKAYLDYAIAYSKSEFEACLGPQPSWHSHDIGLHHWDGFWFGKRMCWGDTLPHHWNGTGACAIAQLARLSNDTALATRASVIPLQLLGLIRPDGTAGCAFVYPDRVNGTAAKFLDPLCNDQDWVMAYFLESSLTSRPCKRRTDVAKFDVRIARDTTMASADGMVWIDSATLPMESKVCAGTATPYGRIPADLIDKVPEGVRCMGGHSTGHYFLFKTDSDKIGVRWRCQQVSAPDPYIPPQGMYGVDVYAKVGGKWRFVKNGRLGKDDWQETRADLPGSGLREVMVYLPIRADILGMRLGIVGGKALEPCGHASGRVKPVVHYGTSLVHGGCASRPGLVFTSLAAREVDVPYVNLGFSGQARLDLVMADVMARADAALFVVDPVWNCDEKLIADRIEPFVRRLRELKPGVPILLCEGPEASGRRLGTNETLRRAYEKMKADPSLADIHYLICKGMLPDDGEATHDYVHPNDYGSVQMGRVFAKAIAAILDRNSQL